MEAVRNDLIECRNLLDQTQAELSNTKNMLEISMKAQSQGSFTPASSTLIETPTDIMLREEYVTLALEKERAEHEFLLSGVHLSLLD